MFFFFFFSSRRRHTRFDCDWSSDVCSSDLGQAQAVGFGGLPPVQLFDLGGVHAPGDQLVTHAERCDEARGDRKSTRLNSSHSQISYAVFCLKKKKTKYTKYSSQQNSSKEE